MDYFYAPPLQRDDECRALEDNYMNCLLQKALQDKVVVNKCVLDSVLFFPLECPKWHAKFDDPVEFKLKWKKFIAETKSAANFLYSENEKENQLKKEFEYTLYPEDIRVKKEAVEFTETFKHLDPFRKLTEDADEEFEPIPFLHEETPKDQRVNSYENFGAEEPL